MRAHRRYENWIVDEALPLWADRGRDATGAFYEKLDFDGVADTQAIRRVRVQFRQIYVYAAASLLGVAPDGAEIANRAFQRVRGLAWAPDGKPGWVHLLRPDGSVAHDKRDAYDQAFALLGLSWLYRTRHDPYVKSAIDETVEFVDGWFAARSGGWWEAVDPSESNGDPGRAGLRRQNPHMHALEAMMSLYESTGDRAFLDRAREIYHLFAARFYDWPSNVVIEYFDVDWRQAPRSRQRVEPGHMAEWVYLIREYERLTGETVDAIANPLYAKTEELGLDPSGRFLIDELTVDGKPSKNTRRLWPQTEYIKATLAQYRARGDESFRTRAEKILEDVLDEYLTGAVAGGWRDSFDLDGVCVADNMPASTFYHLFPAFVLSRDLLSRSTRRLRPLAAEARSERPTMDPVITPVVLAGGKGSRLWPLSTPGLPKQFLPLTGERTLLQETFSRVSEPSIFLKPMVVCHESYGEVVGEQASAMGLNLAGLILEPEPRNSAPAIAAAAMVAARRNDDALLLVTPADHLIRETSLFTQLVDNAADAARGGSIVTFGITPTRPETGYGYIRSGTPLGVGGAFEVAAFVEKPDLATARTYLAAGSYLWNSGMFLFRAQDLLEELRRWRPEMLEAVEEAVASGETREGAHGEALSLNREAFARSPSDSIDYAVMEKTDRAAVCPAALTWSDIGSWDALAAAQDGDAHGNVLVGGATQLDCEGVYARSEGPEIAAIGLKDVVIVATGDTVLVTHKDQAQKVKQISELVSAKRKDG